MPAWKGWDESEVRRQSAPAMGFTAINAPAPTADATNLREEAKADVSQRAIAKTPPSNASVSHYLGRDEPHSPAASPARRTSAKKGGGKSKKRASTSHASSASKRRKSGDVSDGMAVIKANSGVQNAAKQQSPTKRATSRQPQKPAPKRNRKLTPGKDLNTRDGESRAALATSTPVYAPATTVQSINRSLPATSLDALKASSGRGATLYSSADTSQVQHSGGHFAQPWLNTATSFDPTAVIASRTAAQPSPISADEEEEGLDLLFDCLEQQVQPPAPSKPQLSKSKSAAQLPTPVPSDMAGPVTVTRQQPSRKAKKAAANQIQTDEDFIVSDDSADEAMADVADELEEPAPPPRSPSPPPPRDRKQNTRDVHCDEDYGGALLSAAEKQLLAELSASVQTAVKPVVRQPFPAAVLDRSPVFGATNATALRTCFRIGEALNAGSQAIRTNKNVLLELYARVTHSWREDKPGRHQHFVLHDLYHDKAPFLNGTFDLWDQSRLWDLDSKAFLVPKKEGIMCRVIARMKRAGVAKWKLEVLSIWEASWEDVEYVAGIYEKRSEGTVVDDD